MNCHVNVGCFCFQSSHIIFRLTFLSFLKLLSQNIFSALRDSTAGADSGNGAPSASSDTGISSLLLNDCNPNAFFSVQEVMLRLEEDVRWGHSTSPSGPQDVAPAVIGKRLRWKALSRNS